MPKPPVEYDPSFDAFTECRPTTKVVEKTVEKVVEKKVEKIVDSKPAAKKKTRQYYVAKATGVNKTETEDEEISIDLKA